MPDVSFVVPWILPAGIVCTLSNAASRCNVRTARLHPDLAHARHEVEQISNDEDREDHDHQADDVFGPHGSNSPAFGPVGWQALWQIKTRLRSFRAVSFGLDRWRWLVGRSRWWKVTEVGRPPRMDDPGRQEKVPNGFLRNLCNQLFMRGPVMRRDLRGKSREVQRHRPIFVPALLAPAESQVGTFQSDSRGGHWLQGRGLNFERVDEVVRVEQG